MKLLTTLSKMSEQIWQGIWETLIMLGISIPVSVFIGTILGICLFATENRALFYHPTLNKILSFIIDVIRAFPFVILVLYISPLTKFVLQTSIGAVAASFGLSVGGAFFFARLVEQNLREVPKGIVEAAVSMGASPVRIIVKVLLSETRLAMVLSITMLSITLLSYSAAVGMIGGGGIGDLAIRYGYHRFQYDLMSFLVLILIAMVIAIQSIGNFIAKKLDKR